MVSWTRVKSLAWKDALELLRDRRSLALMVVSAFLFPLLGVLVTGLKSQQKALVAVETCDDGDEAEELLNLIVDALRSYSPFNVTVVRADSCSAVPGAVLTVAIPRGFSVNASSLERRAVVLLYRLVGSAAADDAESVVSAVVSTFSRKLAVSRVEELARRAGLRLEPDTVLDPVTLRSAVVTAAGTAAPQALEERAQAARFLAFAVFFVLNPAAVAVADTVTRERETGTGELLAITPLTGFEFVAGKMLGSLAAVAVAGGLDLLAAAAYGAAVQGVAAGFSLALFHAAQTVMAVVVTVAVTVLATMLVSGQRAATMLTSMVTGSAMIVFFAALFVDFNTLPLTVKAAMYLVPYTHTVLAIEAYALGYVGAALLHTGMLAVLTLAALAAAARLYTPTRLVKRG